jgi:hypothetical protein
MMRIEFRDTAGEFKVVDGYVDYKTDPTFAVSITANIDGFLPAPIYLSAYNLKLDDIRKVAEKCNLDNKCILINDSDPKVILVPHTKGKNSDSTVKDFFELINQSKIEVLHFTHYNWLLSFPEDEVKLLLNTLNNVELKTSLLRIIIDTPNPAKFDKILNDIKNVI